MAPVRSNSEIERLAELRRYAILDTPPEAAFDDLTKLAAYLCATPVSLVSLVDADRIWFKSQVGLCASEIPRIDGFCSSTIESNAPLIVTDARADDCLAGHPLVTSEPNLRFYAGAPLVTPKGYRIGTLCVIDSVPRTLTPEQIEALNSLARTVVTQLELRRSLIDFQQAHARTEAEVRQRTEQLASTNESLRMLSARLLRAQDEERRRIARELHDSTGQSLAALSMNIDQMERQSSAANATRFEECRALLTSATTEIRNLSYLLHPPLMDEIGLAAAVIEYANGFAKRSGLTVEVEVSPDLKRLEADHEIALFRILQEALGNVRRHSGSRTAFVKIAWLDEDVVLEVRDEGRGFKIDSSQVPTGVGIRSMQERLRPLGGSVEIESNGAGTTVRASLPRHASPRLAAAKSA